MVELVAAGDLIALVVYPDSVAALELEAAGSVEAGRLDLGDHVVALDFAAAAAEPVVRPAVVRLVAVVAGLVVVVAAAAAAAAVAGPVAAELLVAVLVVVVAVAEPVAVAGLVVALAAEPGVLVAAELLPLLLQLRGFANPDHPPLKKEAVCLVVALVGLKLLQLAAPELAVLVAPVVPVAWRAFAVPVVGLVVDRPVDFA